MKNAVFCDVGPCWSCVNRCFGGTYASIFRVEKSGSEKPPAHAGSSLADFSTLKMEAMRSSDTSVHTRSTGPQIPEDGILNFFTFWNWYFIFLVLRCFLNCSVDFACKYRVLFRVVKSCCIMKVVEVQHDVVLCGFRGWLMVTKFFFKFA
jgi:hypothetical protein